MSFNQSKVEKSEGQQLRKTDRSGSSGQQRGYSGGSGGKGGGSAPPPQLSSSSSFPSSSNNPHILPNRSFKNSGNGQGGSSRANSSNLRASDAVAPAAPVALRGAQNGGHVQPPFHGPSDAPASSASKPVDVPIPRNSRAHPRAPISQSAAGPSNSATPVVPAKGDGSKTFTLQFGSISPGIVDGMQIPARTSSAPPNLDEQKQAQGRHGSFRGASKVPIPTGPQQPQPPKKDAGGISQSNAGGSLPPAQVKQDMHSQISAAPAVPLPKSSVLPIAGISMPMAFQQPHVPLQFGGPNPQLQSQGVAASSLQMPMTLPVGNVAQVPQQMFLHGLQPHLLQPQPMMHQGQSLGFASQMGHQLPPQLGNLGISIPTQQFAQQQPGKFGAPRKITVRITHPETHEELRLGKRTDSYTDGSFTGQRPLPNVASQSQPLPPFTPSHYGPPLQPNAYNPSQMLFHTSTSLPLTSSPMPSGLQAPRYSYSVGQSGQAISITNPSVIKPVPGSKYGPPLHSLSESLKVEAVPVSASSAPVQGMAKSVVGLQGNKAGTSSVTVSMPISNAEAPRVSKHFGEATASHPQRDRKITVESSVLQSKSASQSLQTTQATTSSVPVTPHGDFEPGETGTDCGGKEPVQKLDLLKDNHKLPNKRDLGHSLHLQQKDASESADGLSRNSEKVQEFSGADMSIATTSLSSLSLRQKSSSEIRNSKAVESQLVPTESESFGVNLVKEISQDVCLRADSGILLEEKGSAETSTSLGLEMDETVPKKSYPTSGQDNSILLDVEPGQEAHAEKEHGETEVFSDSSRDTGNAKPYRKSVFTECVEVGKPVELAEQDGAGGDNSEILTACGSFDAERQQSGSSNEAVGQSLVVEKTTEESDISARTCSDFTKAEAVSSSHLSFSNIEEEKPSSPDAIANTSKEIDSQDVGSSNPDVLQPGIAVSAPVTSKVTEKLEEKVTELSSEDPASVLSYGPKDKPVLEPPRVKPSSGKKKKRKEILSKADAAGTSDLYNAYKGPEEKHETTSNAESVDSPVVVDANQHVTADTNNDVVAGEGDGRSKVEVDDWEDAADISTPKLRIPENGQQASRAKTYKDDDRNETVNRKYSRDFLLTFSEQCTDLPERFEIKPDIADAFISASVAVSRVVDRETFLSPGRITERSPGISRVERYMVGIVDDKWTKASSSFASVRDLRPEVGHGGAVMNFRPGQGVSHGVLRHPRGQSSGQFAGGILSGPMQAMASQVGIPRNGADADRWQRSPGTQRGLIPSPQTPAPVMHKTQNRYLVGKVTDEEETKQRRLKAILNKLTPQNFEKLFQQVKEVNIDNTVTLSGVISQIFDKALTEPTFCEMYADFCYHLASELPDFTDDKEKITFKRLLLNKCQEEFERGEREEAEANEAEVEGEAKQSEEEREEKRIKARRRMLGNIRLIGELYKKRMLTEKIMHGCIKKLLGQYQNPDEEDIEALCKLMSTIGKMIDHPRAKEHMDAYFDMMAKLSTHQKLSSRVRFLLRDAIDLRKNKWQQRRKVEGPKKIEEVHREAAQERQAQASRSARGSGISVASRRGPSIDYGTRGSTIVPSPSSQIGNINNLPPQVRGYGSQDVRLEDRHPSGRSFPLPQRPSDDDSITLGPQGGLARGMSVRGPSLISNVPLAEISPSDQRRMPPGPNGYNRTPDWTPASSKEEMPKHMPERFSGAPHDVMNPQDCNTYHGSRDKILDRSSDRSAATILPAGHAQGSLSGSAGAHSEAKQLSEEVLCEKSMSAIREFYSARDEGEVSLCIKELNCPNFYPAMISLWVTDSFERKDMERDLLAALLVNLCKSQDSLLDQVQLIQGFESVLTSLEDAVNDAPRAAEFLGRIFAKVILENVVPLREIGQLIHQGGEEPGRLLELGLASEVLGSILEVIEIEKGEAILNEIRVSSNLQLEDFRPPHPVKANKLGAFL
ncbi:eukaryotic translation initiation factor 4G-like [Phoenix dactylifera]|uniref:Eukaryotic translation initiation factor 4G n=1 Tax=Phoenix dactylifera TaxID=42345 RepID=A0A8B8ZDQ6_PHODC|nr:eukaryotic translation initiation factor 4G-like [Phoenix dactylifera]